MVGVIIVGLAAAAFLKRTPLDDFSTFRGPERDSALAISIPADWRSYASGGNSRLAILLTDEDSAWLGIAEGLKSIGVPFLITDDPRKAVQHHVVLVYPSISGRLIAPEGLDALRDHVESGGTLVANQVLGGGLQDLFGFSVVTESHSHSEVRFTGQDRSIDFINHPRERAVRIGDPDVDGNRMGSQVFENPESALATYEDGSAALVFREAPSGGRAYALGIDLGFFILRAVNDRDVGGTRNYANQYEPSVDTWLRWLKAVYVAGEPDAVTLGTVPEGRDLAVVLTFDVDYADSILNIPAYASVLAQNELSGTFFIQTKYFRDYFDTGFFNDEALPIVRNLANAGMEIGSHSVSHSNLFSDFPLGSGSERYPGYQPRVRSATLTEGASIFGELRVSKYLLEQTSGQEVVSFRPGYLATPAQLPEALDASGYRYASTVTAGNTMTHLPYRMTFSRDYSATTATFQFPIGIEDEIPPHMNLRLNSAIELAQELADYGGSFVILIHPNITDEKLEFLRDIIPALEPFSWFGTLRQYGVWWEMRDQVSVDSRRSGDKVTLTITCPVEMRGLTLNLEPHWTLDSNLPKGVSFSPGVLYIDAGAKEISITFDSSNRGD